MSVRMVVVVQEVYGGPDDWVSFWDPWLWLVGVTTQVRDRNGRVEGGGGTMVWQVAKVF